MTTGNRRKMLEQLIPEGVVFTRKWLMEESNLGDHAIDNLVKSGQIKLMYRSIYVRGNAKVSWQSIMHTLQSQMQLDYIVGGLTALELKGFSHYLPISKKETIRIYGNDKFPAWINEISHKVNFKRHSRNKLFANMSFKKAKEFTVTIPWKDELPELIISCPEKACLEMLNEVPGSISIEHAFQLMQGMTSLSPRTLQSLLEQCTNIKVKRLFLWLSSKLEYAWLDKINEEKINLGSGNRVIIKGGQMDRTYKITVPKDFQP